MSTKLSNLSSYDPDTIPNCKNCSIGIVVAEWNMKITGELLSAATNTLVKHGVTKDKIKVSYVPGTFELTYGAKLMEADTSLDAVIVLGCVIQGETRHFDFICHGVTQGITQLNLNGLKPFIFGVLTTNTLQQAIDRAGGKHGNKGDEAAITALKMIHLKTV